MANKKSKNDDLGVETIDTLTGKIKPVTRLSIIRSLNKQSRQRWGCLWLKAVKREKCPYGCCINGEMWSDLRALSHLLNEDDPYYVKEPNE